MTPNELLPYAMACQQSYAGAPPDIQDADKLTHVFVYKLGDFNLRTDPLKQLPLFTFEGTLDWEEWLFRDFLLLSAQTVEHPEFGVLHGGIAKGAFGVADAIESYLAANNYPNYDMVGHSKGGGEVLVEAAEMKRRGHPPRCVVAFEAPHVGTRVLADYCADLDETETATINAHGRDIVTTVPWANPLTDWISMKPRLMLPVPDSYSVRDKHVIAGVIDGLKATIAETS